MFSSILKKSGIGSPAFGNFSQIFQWLCDVQENMNPDLNKNSDKCFFLNLKNRAEVFLHTANCNGFLTSSWQFHHSAKFKGLTVGFLQFVDYRIQWKINNSFGSGSTGSNTKKNLTLVWTSGFLQIRTRNRWIQVNKKSNCTNKNSFLKLSLKFVNNGTS